MIRLNPTGYNYDTERQASPFYRSEEEDLEWRYRYIRRGLVSPFRAEHIMYHGPVYVPRERWVSKTYEYGIQLFRMWQRIVRDIIHQSYPARVWRLLRIKLPREIVNLIQYTPPIRELIGPPVGPRITAGGNWVIEPPNGYRWG